MESKQNEPAPCVRLSQPPCSASLQHQIEEIEAAIKPLSAKLEKLLRKRKEVDSRTFISANKITRADVEMSSGDGKPYFGTVWVFAEWMQTHKCSKLWAEWNGQIYHAADLLAGRMRQTPGEVDHLPNVKEHATLSAGAHVDHGVEVKTTGKHVNRAADRGCCASTCCAL